MQRVFHMTAQGALKDPLSGVQYDPAQWPGRIVTVCPMPPGEEQGDFNYLAIVEDAFPVSSAPAKSFDLRSVRPMPASREKRAQLPNARERVPLMVYRASRLWFQCSHLLTRN